MRDSMMRPLLALALLGAGALQPASAAVVAEAETNGLTANNTIATAQVIQAGAFTLPAPANTFTTPLFLTATLQGSNGLNDVDFFRFFAFGGRIFLDMDNTPATFDPLVALFNAAGTLIAYGDDSPVDAGSVNSVDSFLGVFTLPGEGLYYIGISENPNFPTTALTGTETPLVRPGGGFGGYAVTGVATGVSTYDFNGPQPGGAPYTLQVSLEAPVPEPGSFVLMGTAVLFGGWLYRRRMAR